ncbi:MATE family efflux transporter [Thermoproteota archaeon]
MHKTHERLGTEGIKKLVLTQSAPAITGMLVLALYNLIDTLFIGQGVGANAIAGLSIVFPISVIAMALAQGIAVGGASIISRSLGAKKKETAELVLGNIFALSIICGLTITIAGLLFAVPLLKSFGATPESLPFAIDYLNITLLGTIFFTFLIVGNNLLRCEGKAKTAMFSMILSALINIILDPIFIFGFNWGVKGAAWATVISQVTMALFLSYFFITGKSALKLRPHNIKLEKKTVSEITAVGSSAFTRQAANSITIILLNHSLGFYGGTTAIAAFGVIHRLIMLSFMPLYGIAQGLQPIIGFNYGAGNFKRVIHSIRFSTILSTLIAIVFFATFLLIPDLLLTAFCKDPNLILLGKPGLRIITFSLPLVGFQVVGITLFQAIGSAKKALIVSLGRQVLFLIPLLIIMPLFLKLTGVWVSLLLAEILGSILTFYFITKEVSRLHVKHLQSLVI